jgi:hypothetical protein
MLDSHQSVRVFVCRSHHLLPSVVFVVARAQDRLVFDQYALADSNYDVGSHKLAPHSVSGRYGRVGRQGQPADTGRAPFLSINSWLALLKASRVQGFA